MKKIEFIGQRYHRNGFGGEGAIVTIFVDKENGRMVATSGVPERGDGLTPTANAIVTYGEKEAYVRRWVDTFAAQTIVLSAQQIAEGDVERAWRGGDTWGADIAREWRRRCQEGIAHKWGDALVDEWDKYDPATSWYEEQRPEQYEAEEQQTKRERAAALLSDAEIDGILNANA